MKKNLLLTLGVIFLGVACSKESAPSDTPFVLRADLPENQEVVKTGLNDYVVVWNAGDKISINGILSNAVASSDEGKRSVDFTFASTPSAPYNTIYPGTSSSNTIAFPASQNYVVNSFDKGAAPSYGVATMSGEKHIVSLTPLATALRFALNGSATITKIVINNLGSEKITGNFTVNFGTGAISASGSNGTSITYNIGAKTLSGDDTYFYVTIPKGTYASGLEALVYEQTTEKYMRLTFGKGKTYEAGTVVEFVSKTYAAGRVEEVAAINDFTAQAGGDPEKKASFTVANYNILSDIEEARSGSNEMLNLTNCREQLGKCIKATGADLICFNEVDETFAKGSDNSIQKIAEDQGFTGYTWRVTNPNKVTHEWISYEKEYTFANGFAFNSSVFEYVNEGSYYWFNKNGGYTGNKETAYGSHLDKFRTFVYAKLKHKTSGKTFNILVTHLPNYNDGNSDGDLAEGVAHNYAATAINSFMTATDASGAWLLFGDMNAYNGTSGNPGKNYTGYQTLLTKWTDSYEAMESDGTLSDFYKKYIGTQSGTNYYYGVLQYTKNHPERRIDHIMYRGGFKAEGYKTIRLTYYHSDGTVHPYNESDEWCPSDHLPVVVNVILN